MKSGLILVDPPARESFGCRGSYLRGEYASPGRLRRFLHIPFQWDRVERDFRPGRLWGRIFTAYEVDPAIGECIERLFHRRSCYTPPTKREPIVVVCPNQRMGGAYDYQFRPSDSTAWDYALWACGVDSQPRITLQICA